MATTSSTETAKETSSTSTGKSDTTGTGEGTTDDKTEEEKVAEKFAAEKFQDVPEVKAETLDKIRTDPRFAPPVTTVTTAEDAYYAYLREEIDENEMRAVVAMNGGSPFFALKANLERPDNAYKRSVPEDMYDDPSTAVLNVEQRLEIVQAREKDQQKAEEKAAKERESAKAGGTPVKA